MKTSLLNLAAWTSSHVWLRDTDCFLPVVFSASNTPTSPSVWRLGAQHTDHDVFNDQALGVDKLCLIGMFACFFQHAARFISSSR